MAIMNKAKQEKSFPRGSVESKPLGTDSSNLPPSQKVLKRKVEKDLFSNKEKVVKKKKLKKAKKDEKTSLFDVKTVSTLTYSSLSEGQLLLGFISQVQEYELKVSLAGHLVGSVPITNISTDFTNRLRAAAEVTEEDDASDHDLPSLDKLYKVGDIVAAAVVSVDKDDRGRYNLILSLSPNRTMAGRIPGMGEILTASITSKEDHGYIMDLGSNTIRGFVPSKTMTKVGEVEVGQVLWCLVTRVEAGVRTLSPVASKVWSASSSAPSVHNLFPGTSVKTKVEAVLSNGLKLSLPGGLVGYVHADMLPDLMDLLEEYSPGTEVEARVMYLTPTVNTVMMTLRDVRRKNVFGDLSVGQLVEKAVIEKVHSSHLVLKLDSDQWGVVSVRNMKEGKEVVKNVKKKFKEGSSVSTRILGLDYCSGVAVCSLHKAAVSGVQRIDQLTIGEIVTVTVSSWCNAGLLVAVGPNLQGLVPRLFLSDVQLSHPEKKYLPGDKLPARVLRLDPAKRRLLLTTKPILVKEQFTIVGDYDTAVPGTITEGVVVKISDQGLLIQLWGDLRGWAPKSQLSSEPIDMPDKIFWLGQAVKCRILDADPSTDKISLSLILDSMGPIGRKERKKQVLTIGKHYEATVAKIGETSVDVTVEHDDKVVAAMIPFQHLTDNVTMVESLANSLTVGQKLSCMAWHKDVVTVLTMKKSLMENYESYPRTYDDYRQGLVVPGVVTLIKKFGVFLRVPHLSKPVLCPTRMLQSYFVEDAEAVLEVGQTVMAKVMDVDSEDKKMTVSCSLDNVGWSLETMGQCLGQYLEDQVRSKSAWTNHNIGDIVTATVANITEFGSLLDIGGVRGVVTNSNVGEGDIKEGASITGVVIFIDSLAKVVEISCKEDLVKAVKQRKKNKIVRKGDNLKGQLIMSKTDFSIGLVMVTHPPHLSGVLGHLTSRRHYNDLVPADMGLEDGQEVSLLVQEVTERGENVLVLEKDVRRAGGGVKLGKRIRAISQSEDIKIDGVLVKKKKVSEESFDVEPVKEDTDAKENSESNQEQDIVEEVIVGKNEKDKKKKSKKKKEFDDENKEEPEVMDTDENKKEAKEMKSIKDVSSNKDPGWDFSATCITAPSWKQSSIWSDDEIDEDDSKEDSEKTHVSKAEAKRRKRVEEEQAAAREQRILDGEVATPTTVEEFERLVMGSPDSSLVWVQYMALVMQTGELDTARTIARRALERINFRLEAERLNIFLAWLNLENTFGNEEAMAKVLKEALQCCDEYKVYTQVATIYSQSSKIADAERIYKLLVRKFNKEKDVWIKFGIFYYKNNKLSDGRFVLQRSLQSLDKRDHIEMSSKFAQIEFRYGECERGKTMFETILANYPKRTDLWSVYADQLTKTGDLDSARALFRRMATLNLQAKKMKFLFKKWLDFETGHGTEAGVSEVKQSAQRYLEGKGMGTEDGAQDEG